MPKRRKKRGASATQSTQRDVEETPPKSTPPAPTPSPKARVRSRRVTRAQKSPPPPPTILYQFVPTVFFESEQIYETVRLVRLHTIRWPEVRRSGQDAIIAYADKKGLQWHRVSAKVEMVARAPRFGTETQWSSSIDDNIWEELQSLIEHQYITIKRTDIKVTITIVYSRRPDSIPDGADAAVASSMNPALPPPPQPSQKKEAAKEIPRSLLLDRRL